MLKIFAKKVNMFDGGDLFHGTLPLVDTKGEVLLPLLEKMQLDGFVPGNWEYAYGKQQLVHLTRLMFFAIFGLGLFSMSQSYRLTLL